MDQQKSILNVGVSVFSRVAMMLTAILAKRYLIQICGNEINGLNALYISILDVMAVAELGIGSAITYCMYDPIVKKDVNKVSALYQLFRRLYLAIGGLILAGGLVLTPFIQFFARDYQQLDVNYRITFLLMLISVVITYLFGAKSALINAHKNNYITTAITSGGTVFQNILQIVTLLWTGSFVVYLSCRITTVLIQWGVTEWIARKKYRNIIGNKQKLQDQDKKNVVCNIKAMFMHKIGAKLVNTADSIVISIAIGVTTLGLYSNYITISNALLTLLSLVFSSLTSVWGHLYVKENKKTTMEYFERFHVLNFLIGTVFFLGYYAIIDNLVAVLFGPQLCMERTVAFVIAFNGFVQYMRQNTLTFRDATGCFYYDRWKPLLEGGCNLLMSIFLVGQVGVIGVLLATITTNLVICHVIEPYVLYKNAFDTSPKNYYLQNYGMILTFGIALVTLNELVTEHNNQWFELLINGSISVVIALIACCVWFVLDRGYQRLQKMPARNKECNPVGVDGGPPNGRKNNKSKQRRDRD